MEYWLRLQKHRDSLSPVLINLLTVVFGESRYLPSPIPLCHLATAFMPALVMSLPSWRCSFWSTICSPNSGIYRFFIYILLTRSEDIISTELHIRRFLTRNSFFCCDFFFADGKWWALSMGSNMARSLSLNRVS